MELPAEPAARLVFQTHLPKPGGNPGRADGVVFRVRVNGDRAFDRTVTGHAMDDASIDLAAFAGRTVELTLEVGSRGNNDHDAAQFLAPAVQLVPDP